MICFMVDANYVWEMVDNVVYIGVIVAACAVLENRFQQREKYLNSLPLDKRLAAENGLERAIRKIAEWGSD